MSLDNSQWRAVWCFKCGQVEYETKFYWTLPDPEEDISKQVKSCMKTNVDAVSSAQTLNNDIFWVFIIFASIQDSPVKFQNADLIVFLKRHESTKILEKILLKKPNKQVFFVNILYVLLIHQNMKTCVSSYHRVT